LPQPSHYFELTENALNLKINEANFFGINLFKNFDYHSYETSQSAAT